MEHLLIPAISDRAKVQIPYVAHPYDQGEFEEYGSRHGCENTKQLLLLYRDSRETFHSLIQTWLYFGLLREAFGSKLCDNDFVQVGENSSARFVDSSALHRYGLNWVQQLQSMERDASMETIVKITKSIMFTKDLVDMLDDVITDVRSMESVTILAVKLLVEFLTMIAS